MNSKILILSSIVLLVVSIPNAFADKFDEETCLSLISAEQVQSITGYDKTLNARVVNANLESLNEGMGSGCVITFEREGLDFGLTIMASAFNDENIAQSKYGEVFSASHQSGKEVTNGNNGPWVYHQVVFKDMGIDSIAASIKDNIQVGVSAPTTNYSIEPSAIIEVLEIIQSKVDKLDIAKSFEPKPALDLYDPSTSSGVNVIFDRCQDNDIWWAHLENDNGERITDAVLTLYSKTGTEIGQMSVSKKDGSFGTSTLGQDPSAIVDKIDLTIQQDGIILNYKKGKQLMSQWLSHQI